MKRNYFKIILFIVLLITLILLFLFAYEYKSEQEQLHNRYRLSKEEIALLEDGDIILRQGFGLVSESISRTLSEEFKISHCAIVRKPTPDSIIIIHSVSSSLSDVDGVQSCGLKKFVQESQKGTIIVTRFKSAGNKSNSVISDKADYYLQKQVKFDNSFDIRDSSKFFCTELIWKIIVDEFQMDILNIDQPDQISANKFGVFWNSPHFEVIFNHHLKKNED